MAEELPVPAGLNERILQATLGTVVPHEVKAPWTSRVASAMRLWLDPIVSPQLATVATMLLVAVLVMANTVSADGSISGVYEAGLKIAEETSRNSNTEFRKLTDDQKAVDEQPPPPPAQKPTAEPQQKDQHKSATKPDDNEQNNH
jgi:hypothetical protein